MRRPRLRGFRLGGRPTYFANLAVLALLVVLPSSAAWAQAGDARSGITPPPEEVGSYLRDPAAIAGLAFPMGQQAGWTLSEVVFGVREGHLMIASFLSTNPDGLIERIDDTAHAQVIVEDTSKLPLPVYERVGGGLYEIRGFTIGATGLGEAYVDWVHLVGPDGVPEGHRIRPPHQHEHEAGGSGCTKSSRAICFGGFCTAACTVSGADPCDCSGTGFCFVDYQVFRCENDGGCPGSCIFTDPDTCGCFIEDGCFPAKGVRP